MSRRDLFLCCCCSFLTRHNSLLFYFIRYIIGNFFVFVLSVYVCVFLHLSVSWRGFLHRVTSRLVSLLLLLLLFISHSSQLSFVLFHLIHYWQFFCVCIECLWVCFIVSLGVLAKLSASCHVVTCFFVDADAVHFSLVTTLFCFISLDTLLATFFVCIECLCVCFLASLCNFCEASCMVSHCDLFLC